MWSETGLTSGLTESTPQEVADAVIDLLSGRRPEADVASRKLRLMATIALLKPDWVAARNRKGAAEFAKAMTNAHASKW